MTSEASIERRVVKEAKAEGWLVFKWTSPNNRGVPDRIFIRCGRVVFIEFKAAGKKPTKLQNHIIAQLEEQEVEVYVVDSIEDGIRVLA